MIFLNINKMAKFLYISHDGLLEPLGQSQVLGYLEKLSNSHKIFIISYEKEKDMLHVDKVNFLKKNLNKTLVSTKIP